MKPSAAILLLLLAVAAGETATASRPPIIRGSRRALRAEQGAERNVARSQWPNTEATDECTPFDPSVYGKASVDEMCAKLNSLSDAELIKLHAEAPLPNTHDGFPIRGCTHRCILGGNPAALIAKMPDNNLGWGGKCFNWDLDPVTGTPTELINIFSPEYDNASLPDSERVKGSLNCRAKVYMLDKGLADGRPVWVMDHSISEDLYDPKRNAVLVVNAFRDEMREIRPGLLLGRIFLRTGPETANELPIFFALMQACTADGHFPTTPEARALPRLGSNN